MLQFSPCFHPKPKIRIEPIEEIAVLSLAPFTPIPKICFDNAPILQTSCQRISIKNPAKKPIQLSAFANFPPEVEATLNWTQITIDSENEVLLEIKWTPREPGAWRHTLRLETTNRIKKDLPIVFKATKPGKKLVQKHQKSKNSQLSNKENKWQPLLPNKCETDRRSTFVVKTVPKIESPEQFSDSLESPTKTIGNKLDTSPFLLSPLTPHVFIQQLRSDACSTDEGSFANIKNLNLNDSTPIMSRVHLKPLNSSTGTYAKENSFNIHSRSNFSPSESLVKHDTYIKEESKHKHVSFTTRLNNLLEDSAKSVIEANLWPEAKSPSKNASLKRKAEPSAIYEPVEKRPNIERIEHITDWSKHARRAICLLKNSALRLNKSRNMVETTTEQELLIQDPYILAATCNFDPFLTFSIYSNDEWMEQQEKKFKKWLNALLTPPIEMSSNSSHPVDVARLWKQCEGREVSAAPSREAISNKYHTSGRLEALRRQALALYRSEAVGAALSRVVGAVEAGKLTVRDDRDLHLNLSLQAEIMTILLSYNCLWLRIGLETVYNTRITLNSNSDIIGISAFLREHFFKDGYLLRKHKSVHSGKYKQDIKKFILKRFFSLVFFLDRAKVGGLIQHDPCLFCKNAPIKDSREVLLRFARTILSTVGDLTKYLKYFGYVVEHKQSYLHEFDYAVNNLGVDLRDGVRLVKVMERITLRNDLNRNLRVPAISRLQKKHNVGIVFDSLKMAEFDIQFDINPSDIVDGCKEKTLSFLWQIIYKFQAPLIVKQVIIIQQWWNCVEIQQKREQLRAQRQYKIKAANKIQKWYRRQKLAQQLIEFTKIGLAYRLEVRQDRAAVKIQNFFKMITQRRRFLRIMFLFVQVQAYSRGFLIRNSYYKRIRAVIVLQSHWKGLQARRAYENLKFAVLVIENRYLAQKQMKVERFYYISLKIAATYVQSRFRALKAGGIARNEFLALKCATIIIQQRFRATIMCRLQLNMYKKLRINVIKIQQLFRANKAMEKDRKEFITLQLTTIAIQQRFRANKLMLIDRTAFNSLKLATIYIQQVFKANKLCTKHRFDFLQLKETVVKVQNWFRANQAAKKQRIKFTSLKLATICIQRRLRAKKAMVKARNEFLDYKKSVILVQNRFRANLLMRKERNDFLVLKSKVAFIEHTFLANKLGKIERTHFITLKKQAIFVQNLWRANKAAKTARVDFLNLKSATIQLQARFKGRRQRDNFTSLRKAAICVQQQFRANQLKKKCRTDYLALKTASITIQRRFRANRLRKIERNKHLHLKKQTIRIQQWFRSIQSMNYTRNNYLALKESTILIQRHYRAKCLMITTRAHFTSLKTATIFIQRLWRANKLCKKYRGEFLELKRATTTTQAYLRGKKQRLVFIELKYCAVLVQNRFRANRLARQTASDYRSLRTSSITIQTWFRAVILGRKTRSQFMLLKWSAVSIQRQFRAYLLMKSAKVEYDTLRAATVVIQVWFRAGLRMHEERKMFQAVKRSAVVIQKRFRALVEGRRVRVLYKKLVEERKAKREGEAAVVLQKWVRGWLARRKFAPLLTPEAVAKRRLEKKKSEAAVRIQAQWRGHRSRSTEAPQFAKIRAKLKQASLTAQPHNTLGSRLNRALDIVCQESMQLVNLISSFDDIEFITRRCKTTCRTLAPILTHYIYKHMNTLNRSLPQTNLNVISLQILLNFYRFPATRAYCWQEGMLHLDRLFNLMIYACDKESPLFVHVCTLIWLFAQHAEYGRRVRELPNLEVMVGRIEAACLRKQRMVAKLKKGDRLFGHEKGLPLPTDVPDWGLELAGRPRVFINAVQALKCLKLSLGL